MGRTLTITVASATGLRNADEDEGGYSDPFVIVCFDNKVQQELGRTETASDTTSPEWNHTFDVDVTKHIQAIVDETGEEPKALTFCVYDGDEGEAEPLGVAGIAFQDLVKKGKVDGEFPVYLGSGSVTLTVEMKKVKKSSMLKDNAALKIAGGVAGVAALGLLGGYLYNRYQKKKDKVEEDEEGVKNVGMEYGFNEDDDDDDEEERDAMKKWWEMDDEDDDDDDENRWTEM